MGREYGMTHKLKNGLHKGIDGIARCLWAGNATDYLAYHDEEWGMPVADDQKIFEKICLEGFQSGLSWLTILRKRENFRSAFADFDYHKISKFDKQDIHRLLTDKGIVRHRGKIVSTINNAKRAVEMVEEFGALGSFFWKHEPNAKMRPKKLDYKTLQTLNKTQESNLLATDLKKLGWTFVGPITAYAFMQAIGMVNDHVEGCEYRNQVEQARKNFQRPS